MARVVTSIAELREGVRAARQAGRVISLVPTMGALHAGHAALIRAARKSPSDLVVVSVFVNPTQFGPNEDFDRYPRTMEADVRMSAEAGADLVFAPPVSEVYAGRSLTWVEVSELQDRLEGPTRPGHFRGVCTVVLKLLNMVQPDRTVFGQKDAQQARIVRQMIADLNVPVIMQVEPTVREADGLAMSSRNRYLTPEQRSEAPKIYQALQKVQMMVAGGERNVAHLEATLLVGLNLVAGGRVDYGTIVDADTLSPITTVDRPALALVAVYLGTTRLIDNVLLA